ncbi:MAG: hypothetical protein NTV01_09085, partial [Bacteroidia bacterium]|nr:hypothetical protein [Bacteroidia bacterium]
MNKLLPLFFAAALLGGCQKQPADQIRLTGTVTNADTLAFVFSAGQKADTIAKAAEGTFTYEKVVAKPVNGYLVIGKKYLMVHLIPGKTLTVTVDYTKWDSTLVFGGDLKP